MKKRLSIFALGLILLLQPLVLEAVEVPGYEGGIQNENTYKEVIFITGEAIELEGSLRINNKENKSKNGSKSSNEQYTYKLENKQKGVSLSRSVKFTTEYEVKGSQTVSNRTLDSYKETVDVGGKKYTVGTEDYQWNQGQVVQDTGLLEYYAGDWSARKTYKVDQGDERVVVNTIGNLVGYDSPWSGTETQSLEYFISNESVLENKMIWEGTAKVDASYNKTKDYAYVENVPNQISFRGGYILTEKDENTLKYSYDLPGGNPKWRNMGSGSTQIDTNPIIKRLNVPAMRDVKGLPNEKDLLLIASMDGFSIESTRLGPESPMSRGDFARVIVNTMDIPVEEENTGKKNSRRKKDEEVKQTYIDVDKNHRNYKYIEAVSKNNIMQGVGKNNFAPNRELTKEEAATILVRLLGIQNQAPIQNYSTGYRDDSSISAWAKDSVYMARMTGLIENQEYFYPKNSITKAETAEIMVKFIDYLQKTLLYDFRENILNN